MQEWSKEIYDILKTFFTVTITIMLTRWSIRSGLRIKGIDSKNRVIDTAISIPEESLPTEAQKAVLTHAFYDYSGRSQADPLCIFHVARDYQNPRNMKYLSQYPKAVTYCQESRKILEKKPQPRFILTVEATLALLSASFTALFIFHLPALYQDSAETFDPIQSPLEVIRVLVVWGMIIYPVLAPWLILAAVVRGTYAICSLTQKKHWVSVACNWLWTRTEV